MRSTIGNGFLYYSFSVNVKDVWIETATTSEIVSPTFFLCLAVRDTHTNNHSQETAPILAICPPLLLSDMQRYKRRMPKSLLFALLLSLDIDNVVYIHYTCSRSIWVEVWEVLGGEKFQPTLNEKIPDWKFHYQHQHSSSFVLQSSHILSLHRTLVCYCNNS